MVHVATRQWKTVWWNVAVTTQYRRVIDGQTDGRIDGCTSCDGKVRAMHTHCAVKNCSASWSASLTAWMTHPSVLVQTPSSLTESWNGTTVPVMSMPLADSILSRWALVPNRTASVLAGLRSSPFSRNQRATSSTHSETAVKWRQRWVERPCRPTTACRQRIDGGPDCINFTRSTLLNNSNVVGSYGNSLY